MQKNPDLSFVIPAYEESDFIESFLLELIEEVEKLDKTFEVVVLDGNSKNNSEVVLEKLAKKYKFFQYHILHHPNISVVDKSNKYMKGFEIVQGEYIFQMDADGQDVPKEISRFLKKIEEGYDMVSGWKQNRKDSFFYVLTSRIANFLTRVLTGVQLHDMNNGFKVYKKDVAKSLNLRGGYFRFIPLILTKQGYKVAEIPVEHRKRVFGKGKFSFVSRFKSLFDLFYLLIILKMNDAPGYVFGWGSVLSFLKGLLLFFLSIILYYSFDLFFFSIVLLALAIVFFLQSFAFLVLGILVEYFRFYKIIKS